MDVEQRHILEEIEREKVEELRDKQCPMFSHLNDRIYCKEDFCAWWVKASHKGGHCAITDLAAVTQKLEYLLNVVSRKVL
jgi:hypothetical protein